MNIEKVHVGLSALHVLVLLLAAVVAYQEYQTHIAGTREARAFEFEAAFRSHELFTARENLEVNWSTTMGPASYKVDDSAYHTYIVTTVLHTGIESDVKRIAELLVDISVCVEKQLCDAHAIGIFVDSYGKLFFNRYYPYLCTLNESGKQIQSFYSPRAEASWCPAKQH